VNVTIRRILSAVLLVGIVAATAETRASAPAPAALGGDLPSALVIRKSGNKNQVHYAVSVDDACAPLAGSTVRPYWRMLERGPEVTEPLRDSERRLLGVQRQEVEAGSFVIAVRAMPARSIAIHTSRGPEGRCTSSAETTIAGVRAHLLDIYVQQSLFGIDYVLLRGVSEKGDALSERVSL
jgi:hypothetical protein